MNKIIKEYNFNLNGIDAEHLYYTFKKICLAYENAFHFGAPDDDEPGKFIYELGYAVADILQGDIHDFLEIFHDDIFDEVLEELYIQDAESGADREMGYNPEETLEKLQYVMGANSIEDLNVKTDKNNSTDKTEILSGGENNAL